MAPIIFAIIIVALIILAVWLYRGKNTLQAGLDAANDQIAKQKAALAQAQQDLSNQDDTLTKCRGDLSTCTGKSAEAEVQIASMKATIDQQNSMINSLNARADGYQKLVDDFKVTVDQLTRDKATSTELITSLQDNIRRLNTELDGQNALIDSLRSTITSQTARIQQLESWTYHLAGPVNDKSFINFGCGFGQNIEVLGAQYGGGACGTVDQTAPVKTLCDGNQTCSFMVPLVGRSCPANLGTPQSLAVNYRCTGVAMPSP